jgi:hypothetical protein
MSIKGTLTIERIKDIVGEIMSSCAGKMKFEILEVIMKGVIFENKKLRESFMQEILNSAQNATYKTCLEKELNLNELHCRQYFAEKDQVFEAPIHERVIEYSLVDVNFKFLQRQIDTGMTGHDHHGKKMTKEEHEKADLMMTKNQFEKH